MEWSWKLREFVRLPSPPHLVTLLNVTGTILHKDSEEAKMQLAGGVISKFFYMCFLTINTLNEIVNTISSICILMYAADNQDEVTDEKLKSDETEEDVQKEEEGRHRR